MCLGDVHHHEIDLATVLLVKLIERGDLPPEWRSSVTAKNQHHGASLRGQGGELHRCTLIEPHQRKVRRRVANMQVAGTSMYPQGFKWKQEEWDWPRQFGHEPPECLGRLPHDFIEH